MLAGDTAQDEAGVAGLIDLLAGLPTPGITDITRNGSGRANIDQNIISEYATDTFKLRPNITLVAGLRYDFYSTVNESRNRFSAFTPTSGLEFASQ